MSLFNLVFGFDSISKPFLLKNSTAVAMPMFNSLAAFSKFMLLPSVIYYNYLFILVVTKVCFFSCLLPTIYRKRAFCRHLFEFRLEYLNNINNRLFFQIGSSQ